MAAANESQGLKIAVAVFVSLTVILAVSTYFAYSEYDKANAKYTASESKAQNAIRGEADANTRVESLTKEIGTKSQDLDAAKTEMKGEYKKIDDELNAMGTQVNDLITKAQAAGAQGPELEESKAKVQQIIAAYRAEPNKTYISALARMTELLKNLSLLTTQIALNYVDVKRNLESSNDVNAQKLKVESDALGTSKTDLEEEHKKHESERQSILARIDQYQSDNAKQATEIANLNAKLRKLEDDTSKSLALAQQTIRDSRDRLERKETILDRPDGKITFVDYNRGEVHASLASSTGARPQMQFTIFDAGSPGIPTDKPKGSIELLSVGDRESIGRIVKTNANIDPIRVGDIVYSAAWSPNDPMRFALIGKMDINRDGRDDREDLKRMIAAGGGIVDYDLPPPDAGKETGKLTGRDSWYVIDERIPLRELYAKTNVTSSENTENLKKQSDAIREARLNGVRPMPIERLLPFLGYDYAAPIRGRAEGVDTQSLKRLLAPRQDANKLKPPTADAPKAEGESK